MAIINFNEYGQIEVMPIDRLIEPRLIHMKLLDVFEKSGLYCFGRKPLSNYENPSFLVRNDPT